MLTKKEAASLGVEGAAKKFNRTAKTIPQNPVESQLMTDRELLLGLARNVRELCSMVESWRAEQDRLRVRIAELENERAA